MVKRLEYTAELYSDICEDYLDYYQLAYTVCGAQDPAFIELGPEFGVKHPSLRQYAYVRVVDIYLNSWNSDTVLEFSNNNITDSEYQEYDELLKEEEGVTA